MDLKIDYVGILFINFQLLVDWTRGKNLIFSSGAPSVNELRGPYDVANLSLLLGLSMERAKVAISKNCRYENFLKPHCHLETLS
jgi:ribonuclease P/MRP protein subunit RPP1